MSETNIRERRASRNKKIVSQDDLYETANVSDEVIDLTPEQQIHVEETINQNRVDRKR